MNNKTIIKYYKQFKEFIHCRDLPNINIINSLEDAHIGETFAYILSDQITEETVSVYCSLSKMEHKHEDYVKSKFFHEFTHIYDANILFKEFQNDDIFDFLIHGYSEYHASQIELIASLGYKDVNKVKNGFCLSQEVHVGERVCNIETYIIDPLSSAASKLEKDTNIVSLLSEYEYEKLYIQTFDCICYYLGKYNIVEEYGKKKPHNFFHEFMMFRPYIENLYEAFKKFDISDFSTITEMQKAVDEYREFYVTHFATGHGFDTLLADIKRIRNEHSS